MKILDNENNDGGLIPSTQILVDRKNKINKLKDTLKPVKPKKEGGNDSGVESINRVSGSH